MPLTPAQLVTLKAAIDADGALSAIPNTPDGAYAIADAFNAPASPAAYVWRSYTDADTIKNAITWKNLTPTDAPDGTQAWANRSLACQGIQFNIQTLLSSGMSQLATGRLAIRQGLQDALSTVPSGAGGASQDAGWAGVSGVKAAITRVATRLEKLFQTGGSGTTGSPWISAFVGDPYTVTYQEVLAARNPQA
jgi:hypothetical protein